MDEKQQERAQDSSRAIIERARAGDRHAFDMLVRGYANMVIALASRMLGSREEALDCAQDTFIRAWENIDRYDPKWSVATWLRRIVTNLSLDRLRRRRSSVEFSDTLEEILPSQEEIPAKALEREESAETVRRILDLLPEKYRVVLVLRDMEDVEVPEIAEITGTNAATVRWRLHRARTLFRDRWMMMSGQER